MENILDKLKKMYDKSYYLDNVDFELQNELTKKLDECLLIAQRIAYKNNTLDIDGITSKRYKQVSFNEK
jgi:hypothetical protein